MEEDGDECNDIDGDNIHKEVISEMKKSEKKRRQQQAKKNSNLENW